MSELLTVIYQSAEDGFTDTKKPCLEVAGADEMRKLLGEYKRLELKCREDVGEKLERMKELCKERDGGL